MLSKGTCVKIVVVSLLAVAVQHIARIVWVAVSISILIFLCWVLVITGVGFVWDEMVEGREKRNGDSDSLFTKFNNKESVLKSS